MGQVIEGSSCCNALDNNQNNPIQPQSHETDRTYNAHHNQSPNLNQSQMTQNMSQMGKSRVNNIDTSQIGLKPQIRIQDKERIEKLKKIVHESKYLELEILSSLTIEKGKVLKINAQGMENSTRGIQDGLVFFGSKFKYKNQVKQQQYNGTDYSNNYLNEESTLNNLTHHYDYVENEIINDFEIPSQDQEISERHRGRHFQIEFKIERKEYFIKDLGIGFGTFVKIQKEVQLKENYMFSFGFIFVIVNFIDVRDEVNMSYEKDLTQSQINKMQLQLTFQGGEITEQGLIKTFSPENFRQNQQITVGRNAQCTLQFQDQLLSKIQFVISYREKQGWVLNDGVPNEKLSTNGTWQYLGEEMEIQNGMIFKANYTIFQAKLK